MKIGTKEHYDMLDQFEHDIHLLATFRGSFAREHSRHWLQGNFYCDGHTNDLFKAYCFGYAHARSVYLQGGPG
jgi:hypothetical protein